MNAYGRNRRTLLQLSDNILSIASLCAGLTPESWHFLKLCLLTSFCFDSSMYLIDR